MLFITVSYDSKLMGQIKHKSTVFYCHHQEKLHMCMFRIKLPTKRIFRIIPIIRTDTLVPFCNLFME